MLRKFKVAGKVTIFFCRDVHGGHAYRFFIILFTPLLDCILYPKKRYYSITLNSTMRRLWHRLNTVPSQTHCIFCTAFSKNTLLFPSLLSRTNSTTPILPLELSKSYQTSTLFSNNRNESREETTQNTSLLEPNIRHTNKPALLADIYRSLATQDIDRIWPLYTFLYNNNLLSTLTRKNFYSIFLYTIRSRPCQKNLHRLTALTEDMRKLGIQLRIQEYNALIHWVGGKTVPHKRPHHLLDALQLFDDMQQPEVTDESGQIIKKNPVQPNVSTFNTLIHIAAQLSDNRTAQRLYHDMVSRGLQPDVYTYTTLLQSMSKMGDVSGMDHMLKDIRQNGLNSMANNTVIWNVVMSGYACNGYKDRAYAMFEQMLESYMDHQKRIVTDSVKSKKKKKQHKQQNIKLKQIPVVDEESYRIYIDLLVHDDRRKEAIVALANMDKLGIKPTITIYNTLFTSYMKPANEHLFETDIDQDPEIPLKLDTVKQLYKSMTDIQVKPNSETMYTLVSAFLDLGDTKSALETFVFLSNTSNNLSKQHPRKSIQFNSVATLAKERLLIANKDPSKIEPCQELLDRLNSVVTKSVI